MATPGGTGTSTSAAGRAPNTRRPETVILVASELARLAPVFKLDTAGHETVLHNFRASAGGDLSYAAPVRDSAGNLCGTAFVGGYRQPQRLRSPLYQNRITKLMGPVGGWRSAR